jgi:hypothetical protein
MKDVFEPLENFSGDVFEPLNFDSEYSNFTLGDFLKGITPEQIENVGKFATAGYNTVQTIKGLSGSSQSQRQAQQLQQQLIQQQALAKQQQQAYAQQQAILNERLRNQQQNNLRLQSGAKEPEKKSNKGLIIGLSVGGGVLILATVLFFVLRKKKK